MNSREPHLAVRIVEQQRQGIQGWERPVSYTHLDGYKRQGYYSSKTSKSVGTAGANAILNYQRSRGINPNAYVRTETWVALASNAPAVPEVIPDQCKSAGVVLCVDKAHRKLTYLKSGAVCLLYTSRCV